MKATAIEVAEIVELLSQLVDVAAKDASSSREHFPKHYVARSRRVPLIDFFHSQQSVLSLLVVGHYRAGSVYVANNEIRFTFSFSTLIGLSSPAIAPAAFN